MHETLRALTARLAWVTGAFALCCDDPEFLTRLTRVAMPSLYERHRVVSVIDEPQARYLQAYGGSAGTAFDAHEAWLGQLEFVPERYPLVARDGRLLDALKEVDLLFALHSQATGEHDGPYSRGALRSGLPAENGLRARVQDPRQRVSLSRFFGIDAAELEARLQAMYTDQRFDANVWAGDRRFFIVEG